MTDPSNGYQANAPAYIAHRDRSAIGLAPVLAWAKRLPTNGAVLDLGCGSGVPIARALGEAGFAIHGVDASPAMVDAFRARLPQAPVECATVGASIFFGRHFDGIVAWGLIFLLTADEQARLIDKVSRALTPGGTFYFTAPWQRYANGPTR